MALTYASKLYFKQLPPNTFKSKCLSFQLMQSTGRYPSRCSPVISLDKKSTHNLFCFMPLCFLGLIAPTSKGFFAFLPLGQKIVDKLRTIVEDELSKIGAQKCEVPSMGPKAMWEKSGRWDEIGSEMFKLNDRLQTEYCLQPTAEEMFTALTENLGVIKEKMLPLMLFQVGFYPNQYSPRFTQVLDEPKIS